MIIQSAERFECGEWAGKSVEIDAIEENLSSDGGLIPFMQLDRKLGWTESFAELISDFRRDPTHDRLDIVRQRVFGILADYEDQNDHDTLRSDPIFKLITDRHPDDDDLASQPTISRLENAVLVTDLLKMEDWFIDRFIESFEQAPSSITLDIDTMDDPAHGDQQLTFFHGFYKQHQYLLREITCAENDMVVLPVLLYGDASAKIGAADDLQRVIEGVQSRYPEVKIHVRADSGFAGPDVYSALESLRNVTYSIGMKMNSKIRGLGQEQLAEAVEAQERTGEPQIRYLSLPNYISKRWNCGKTVILKTEVTAHSTSQRVVLSNRPEAVEQPERVYCEYAERGESENRNKELKCDLKIDRLSDHRYMANLFRVMMHSLAHNLIVAMRSLVPHTSNTNASSSSHDLPQAESETVKRKRHNDRRKRNPLAEGQPVTWRMLVIKVAARVIVTTRRVRILISSSWPNLCYLRKASLAVAGYSRE